MAYLVANIKQDVRKILDHNEVTTNLAGLNDVDTLNVDSIIESQIVPACRQLFLVAPADLLKWTKLTSGGELDEDGNVYVLPLSNDVIRLGRAKLSNWAYSVADFVGTDSEAFVRQYSEFSGLRANSYRPVAAMVDADGSTHNVSLYLFGVESDTELSYVTVINTPEIEDGEIDISIKLHEPFAYMCAGFVAEVLKDSTKSSTLMAMAKKLMGESDVPATPVVPDYNYNNIQ